MAAQEPVHTPDTDTPLWRFSLTLWQRQEASELCLELQQQGWSVTRLLCAGWLASTGCKYSGHEPDDLRQWRGTVTESVRSLKKSLDKSDNLLTPLRQALAKAELEAERVELYRAWQALRDTAVASPTADTTRLAEQNLRMAAPDTNGSLNAKTEPMIRHLAQLINQISSPACSGCHPDGHPAP
ncbi:DUF2390 domain-containing protein [Marinobacter bryozoorum]|jgi:uncharacterized protein (TIGR02444 family)|uniref:DUF2390 domain-containing protein n=1 Tax=Marinobacter bryozoorum TaxID=256324 RepID=UPI0020051453|nr:DUF2390 domain-containing protein [Marinobacter bryozoorum]MCK7545252.1 DUF2390 domain-containing protein [Marinobacter bryozoorum]